MKKQVAKSQIFTKSSLKVIQDEMRKHARKTSTMIMMGSVLYSIATGNMTPSYNEFNGLVRPVYMYTVDIQEFAVNKLTDRGTLTAVTVVTNVQDFMKNVDRALNGQIAVTLQLKSKMVYFWVVYNLEVNYQNILFKKDDLNG